ncbi:MAG: hypothetical protein R6V86_05300, partial [Spirochaetia bacterium]
PWSDQDHPTVIPIGTKESCMFILNKKVSDGKKRVIANGISYLKIRIFICPENLILVSDKKAAVYGPTIHK